MKEEIKKRIERHGLNIAKFFNLDSTEPLNLCRKLRTLERKAHDLTLRQCNEGEKETDKHEEQEILNALNKILNFREQNIKVFINGDPRGYALKISDKHKDRIDEINLFRDWGGYGIIAPDLTEQ